MPSIAYYVILGLYCHSNGRFSGEAFPRAAAIGNRFTHNFLTPPHGPQKANVCRSPFRLGLATVSKRCLWPNRLSPLRGDN